MIRAKEYLEEFFHVVITEEMIRDAVHLNNRIRMSLKSLCEVMKLDPTPVSGEDIQKMVLGSKYRFDFQTTPELVTSVRDKILEEYRQGKKLEKRARILITGCPVGGDALKVIRAIEKNGGVVVATENCSGVRALSTMVEEDTDDIYGAIAGKYLSTGCSIMTPNDNRIALLGEIIDEYHVDGVVEVVLTGCHSTGAESFYIRKFVNDEKHLPYIVIDTDYSGADLGQLSTRLAAFIEMIRDEKAVDRQIDMNCCYKIILSGSNAGSSAQDILNEIWEYTGIPIAEYDRQNHLQVYAGPDQANTEMECGKIEREYPDGQGKIVLYAVSGISPKTVEQLADILLKNYSIKKQYIQEKTKEYPDYLWIVAENREDLESIYDAVKLDDRFRGKTERPDGKKMFFSCMQGKEDRKRLIDICGKYEGELEGRILIGNGFQDVSNKEENCKLQEWVMRIALEKHHWKKVLLIENYYHELAVECISEKLWQESIYLDEQEILDKEEFKQGKELYDTLYWYLRMKRNVASTAAKMKLHRNTMLPRIARLNEIMEVDEMEGADCERILLIMEVERRQKQKEQWGLSLETEHVKK